MRKVIKMPRILKINKIEDLLISATFNNGEKRVINFGKLLKEIGIDENSPAKILYDKNELKKAQLRNNTISYDNVIQYVSMRDGRKELVPFEVGADILLKYSTPEKSTTSSNVGQIIRDARRKAGLSQQELAIVSGTSRTHISRIENDKSDIELATLRKIIEVGLGKELEIRIN